MFFSRARTRVMAGLTVAGMSAACESSDDEPQDRADAPRSSISITAPAAGATLPAGSVTVRLSASGVRIVPAGTDEANSGHHHLFINRDPTPVGEPIPTGEGIVHLGAAQTEHALTDLAPGEYTITAVLGDHLHRRIADVEPHTVTITVGGN